MGRGIVDIDESMIDQEFRRSYGLAMNILVCTKAFISRCLRQGLSHKYSVGASILLCVLVDRCDVKAKSIECVDRSLEHAQMSLLSSDNAMLPRF